MITILCILPIAFKHIMEHEISKRLKNEWMIGGSTLVDAYNKCPLVEENGVLIDMTKECFTFYN